MSVGQLKGDELRGDRILIVARSIANPKLSTEERSGRHQRMRTIARDEVRCYLEIPYRWVADK